jgi:hypothetical protein
LACDNACVFCGQEGLQAAFPPDSGERQQSFDDELARARRLGEAVTFVGGEPTLDPRLVERVAQARRLGFRRIGLQTNGRRLADLQLTAELARAGLTDVHLSIHGASPEVHDYHSSVPGSFAQALAAILAASAEHVTVVATTVLTRSNCRVLAPLPRLLASRGVAAWLIAVPHAAGRAAVAFDRVVPRLGVALPFALHALDAAEGLGLPAWVQGAPACLLGPFAARTLPSPPRAYAPACAACGARESCPGLDAAYLARFGGDELAVRDGFVRSELAPELASMFVGPGELAVPVPAVAPAPAEARKRLPMLGKVQPARAEVAAGTERRTGEALREIFPGLFPSKKE